MIERRMSTHSIKYDVIIHEFLEIHRYQRKPNFWPLTLVEIQYLVGDSFFHFLAPPTNFKLRLRTVYFYLQYNIIIVINAYARARKPANTTSSLSLTPVHVRICAS
jgi:hypothetical protein